MADAASARTLPLCTHVFTAEGRLSSRMSIWLLMLAAQHHSLAGCSLDLGDVGEELPIPLSRVRTEILLLACLWRAASFLI